MHNPCKKGLYINHYYFFSLTLIFCFLLSLILARGKIDKVFLSILNNRAFPESSTNELIKFSILRICFGIIIINRGIWVFWFLLDSEHLSSVGIWTLLEILFGFFLAIGFLTQWSLVFLIGPMWQYGDLIVAKSTLGNDVAAILALMLLTLNSGRILSIDSLLLGRIPSIRRLLLYPDGLPSKEAILYSKFSAITCFWAVCVYSVVGHLNEPAWMNGSVGPLLLSNNFMSTWYDSFQRIFSMNPLAIDFARCSIWLMMFWYPAILPFLLIGGKFRRYVIIWGWLFFLLSLFFLKLGYLAEIEILLWIGLFHKGSFKPFENLLSGIKISNNLIVSRGFFFHICLLAVLYLFAIPAPHINWKGFSNIGAQAAHLYGITPIDVFNQTDLRMAENWFVINSIDFNEEIPVFTKEGSRLSMHSSDRIYFGKTLRFRRAVINTKSCNFDEWKTLFEYLSEIYLEKKHVFNGEYKFLYRQFQQPLVSSEEILNGRYVQEEPKILCEKEIILNI